jgi:serine/threonine protein kinase
MTMRAETKSAREIFLAAVDRPPAERSAYLEAACAGDAALRRRVEALLAAHDEPGAFLSEAEPSAAGDTTAVPDSGEAGAVVAGRYTLQEKIGEGGMGEVWVAKQTEPVKRKVALKLIKAGMDTKAVLARFEAERQALALMDHPNIARVLDGGMTPDRRPFFVMELVNGLPLTRYCDEARLGIRERLELFAAICQAVQHAHQKGIIHRDLKPSNILVTLIDGRPVPKVIDFGVAKAVGGKLLDETLSTQFGAIVGTLEYMAPEQAGYSGSDIDTRADIYSLGVILYELLTGLRPIDARRLKEAAYAEMIRIIREDEPSKPSTRLSTDQSLPSLAASRQIEPKKLMALLRGELDWVVMKCLEKQRDRRYETANGLARDIQRYLADEPVEARPPSAGYRLHKFLKRNRGPVLAASLVLLALMAGMIGTTWGLIEARRQAQLARDEATAKENARKAEAEQRSAADAANEQAQKRLTQVKKTNDILGSIFENLDPKEIARADRPLQAILVEKLDKAVAQLEGESIGDPLVVAAMQNRFGISLLGLGEPGKAITLLEKARMTRQAKLGPEDPDTLASMENLAAAYRTAGKLDLAVPLFEETLELMKARLGLGHPDTLASMENLAGGYQDAGKLDLALPLYEETLKLMKAKLDPEHPLTLTGMDNLAGAYQDAGKLDLAVPLLEETLKRSKAKLGPEHPDTLVTMNNLAVAYWLAKQPDKAIPLFEEALKHREAKFGRSHPETLMTVGNLGVNYKDAGRVKEGIPLLEEAHRAAKKHPALGWVGAQLLDAYVRAGDNAKLADLLQEQLSEAHTALPKDSPQLAGALAPIGLMLLERKKWAEAEPLLRECLAIREMAEPDAWTTFNTKSMLGGALLGQKKYADAEPLLLAGYEGMKQREKTIPPQGNTRIPEAIERLVQLYEATGKKEAAAKWRKELEARKKE